MQESMQDEEARQGEESQGEEGFEEVKEKVWEEVIPRFMIMGEDIWISKLSRRKTVG
jgi:hypothetical protein